MGAGDGQNALSASAQATALDPAMTDGSASVVISDLLNRRSVLGEGAYAQVAGAVLDANTRAAEAELRAARLRSDAQATNWLPTLGPSVSLTSLGSVVASLVVEQVLFDNGRKKAEREYAAADVEVAAVNLAQDTNDRVRDALDLYVTAQKLQARAAVNAAAMERMEHFSYVMEERVRGGVSNRADQQVVLQKLNQMRADMIADRESAAGAMAELAAMSARPLEGLSGLSSIGAPAPTAVPLAVLKAQAESTRSVAQARAERAGYLPGVTATGQISGGDARANLGVSIPNGLGLGTGAALEAVDVASQAAEARVGQQREEANRTLAALNSQLESLRRREAESAMLAEQAARNYEIFAAQLKEGQRAVPEVVGIFETKISAEREAVVIRYDIAKLELHIAALLGTLVDGERI